MSNGAHHNGEFTDAPAQVLVREDIALMDSVKLDQYRAAVEQLMTVKDDRGYGYIGTVHGGALSGHPFGPMPVYCQHGTDHFLTWHRAYLYEYEQRLQDIDAAVTIPYWDWASDDSIADGMPQAFLAETYTHPESGEERPNPLLSFLDLQRPATGQPQDPLDWSIYPDTTRNPKSPALLAQYGEWVDEALDESEFLNFTRALENPHNALHTWVRGTMQSFQSSYDPVFWSHHANVDRQFAQWQQRHGDASIPLSVRQQVSRPFGLDGEATLNTRDLGYVYGTASTIVARSEQVLPGGAAAERALPRKMSFNLGTLEYVPTAGRIHFNGMQHTEESYEIRIYANNKRAGFATGYDRDKGYVGSLHLFGHGDCIGQKGHCDIPTGRRRAFDQRPPHHLTPFDTFVNISSGLGTVNEQMAARTNKSFNLTFIVVDSNDKQVPTSMINFDSISLVFDR